MPPLRVLISGSSVAGPALAYWLLRASPSAEITIVERAPVLRKEGQGIDVRDAARDVLRKMHIFDEMRARSSNEEGIRLVDANDRTLASFGVDLESGNGDSPTCDIEILRGEVADILFGLTKDKVKYVFGEYITAIEQKEREVTVSFANNHPQTTYDLVVAADGLGSKTRGLAFSKDDYFIKSINAYVSYFSLPPSEKDSLWARVHWCPGGRNMALRPDNQGRTRAFMTMCSYHDNDPRLQEYEAANQSGDIAKQKAVTAKIFADADWEAQRLIQGMHESKDFYLQHIAQVRMKRWSTGRVVVVGDAGYAPSPFTGAGTSLAFLGAYILAGEISKHVDDGDIPAALAEYEKVFKPHVDGVQKLPPGIPWIVNPQSSMGVKVLETMGKIIQFVKGTWVARAFLRLAKLLPVFDKSFKLPEYEAFREDEVGGTEKKL